jgi:transposase-like protein
MSERTHYSDEQKAEALAVLDGNDGNYARTSRDTGIPRPTLKRWDEKRELYGLNESVQEKKEGLSERLEALAHLGIDALTPERLATAPVRDVATAVGIAIDKARLLRGEPTAINENRQEDVRARILHRLDRLATVQKN